MVRADRKGRRSRARGAVAVEFAFVAPILVLIVFGCVDFGRFAHTAVALANAARAGASYGAFHYYDQNNPAPWTTGCQNAAIQEMSDFNIGPNNVTAEADRYAALYYRAKVTVQYQFNTVVSWPQFPNQITMQQTVVMSAVQQRQQ
jgi:Flp pilus assembly protein TadG